MVELDRYVVLEAAGRWTETPDAAPRDVIVTLGNSTLILTDLEDRPLAHWALAGVQMVDARDGAAVYAMSPEAGETLEIADADMIEAIDVARLGRPAAPAPQPVMGRLLVLPLLVILLGVLIVLGPRLIRAQAERMVPPEVAETLGQSMLLTLMEDGGGLCDEPGGQRALDRIARRVGAGADVQVRALDLGGAPVAVLPGPLVLIDHGRLDAGAEPAEIAGWIAVGLARDPVPAMIEAVGPVRSLGYVVTGDLPATTLALAARAAPRGPTLAEAEAAFAHLSASGLDPRPLADALLAGGLPLPAAALPRRLPETAGTEPPDTDMAALAGICGLQSRAN